MRRNIDRPGQPLANSAVSIEHLISQARLVERRLNTMQVLDPIRHSVGCTGPCCADLKYPSGNLHIKGKNMAAPVGEHPGVH
jgi:hypothetical protein